MIPSLFAALVPASALALQPPALPLSQAPASVGVHVERTHVSAENFSDAPRWLVLTSRGFHAVQALAPHAGLTWPCTEESLWDVDLRVADTDGGVLHVSSAVSLYGALENRADALWFGQGPDCWVEAAGRLLPFFEGSAHDAAAPAPLFHVPVVRPSDRPVGDRPPPIENKPLPPI
ncbi:MAG: hypothetical protein IPJ19_17085 [Planctomycetes bacterium]|nr:hypothetical protein [Planctomycetota bacterium]